MYKSQQQGTTLSRHERWKFIWDVLRHQVGSPGRGPLYTGKDLRTGEIDVAGSSERQKRGEAAHRHRLSKTKRDAALWMTGAAGR